MRVLIYGLVDPRTDHVFYVGQTINPKTRLAAHMNSSGTSAHRTVRQIRRRGLPVVMKTLAVAKNSREANRLEVEWMRTLPGLVNAGLEGNCGRGRPKKADAKKLKGRVVVMLLESDVRRIENVARLASRDVSGWAREKLLVAVEADEENGP